MDANGNVSSTNTVDQLKAFLDGLKVSYPSTALKNDLITLANKAAYVRCYKKYKGNQMQALFIDNLHAADLT